MTAHALYSPAAGDRDDHPSPPQRLSRAAPDGRPVLAPYDPRRGVGAMGVPAAPTVPSAQRLRQRGVLPAGAPGAPISQIAPMAPGAPISAVVPVTYAPAEPAPNVETHLTPEEPGDMTSYIPLPGCPHPLFRFLRRWAAAFLPSLVATLSLVAALQFVWRGGPVDDNLASLGGVPTLFAIFLIGSALFGLALYFAPTDGIWLTSLVLGGLLLPTLIFAPLLGKVFGSVELLLALVLVVVVLRQQSETVADNTIQVTKLLGRYFRIIRAGQYLRLPFERVVATLDTHEHIYTTPTQYTELSAQGVLYRGRGACTVIYAILPGEAQRVVPMLDTWEPNLRRLLVLALREALGDWAAHVTITGAAPPQGTLARSVLGEARAWAHPRGIWIMRVRVHNIWLEPASSLPARPSGPSQASHPPSRGSRDAPADFGPYQSSYSGISAPRATPAYQYPISQPVAVADLDARGAPSAPEAPAPVEVAAPVPASPEVLAAAYEAVRDGRISDPVTIRGIAQAFARAAEHPPTDAEFPYDATAAARILWDYADKLEQRIAVSAPAPALWP